MGQFQGLRANQLTGYGLVVGLAGTGDDSLDYSTLGMQGAISRFGLTLPPGVNQALQNAAAVMITAEQIGRASCRLGVCQYVSDSVVAVTFTHIYCTSITSESCIFQY